MDNQKTESMEDLFYYAFNYRNASTDSAGHYFGQLEEFVNNLLIKEREECRELFTRRK